MDLDKNLLLSAAVIAISAASTTVLKLQSKEKKKRNRRIWVRSWVGRRDSKGIMNLVTNELLTEDPLAFKNYLRMSNTSLLKLLGKVENLISKQDTVMRQAIPAKHKLIIALRYLATGETFRNIMFSTRVHESTIAQFVPVVCRAIYSVLVKDYIKLPETCSQWEEIATGFYNEWQIPNVLGALDGKHIAFCAPLASGSTYYNYKGFHSIVLLALTDAKYRFTYIDVGVNGRVSDGGVFSQSDLYRALENNSLNIPLDKPLPGMQRAVPYVILADAAFPLKKNILKPYPFRGLTEEQAIFNYRLSRGRRVVENAFGILANRFRILLGKINLGADKTRDITLACCALHNFLIAESNLYVQSVEHTPTTSNDQLGGIGQQIGNRPSNTAMQIREEFNHYFNGIGAVEWQNNMI
ncbi:putative nuclease HARBI1 [Photinus pyralis]|uniref:putative nuclease HARBI1 n=1 Tax=Photinus pyralis TaxID=7054 RepID=UPI001267405C|nr:putative nuclease HARBI1 [Photinus pyralis]